jgi:hypothetical protein
MDDHERKQRAAHAENLLRDDVLKAAFEAVRQHCLSVMTNPAEGDEKVLQARRDLIATDRAENQLRSFVADGRLIDKKDRDR